MSTAVVVAILAPAASLVAAAVMFYLTKSKEREATWRDLRIVEYKELVSAMSAVAVSDPGVAARQRLAAAANNVSLFASPTVLRHLQTLLEAVAAGRNADHDETLTSLMHAIRSDLGVPGASSQLDIKFKLWAPGSRNL